MGVERYWDFFFTALIFSPLPFAVMMFSKLANGVLVPSAMIYVAFSKTAMLYIVAPMYCISALYSAYRSK
jgi:hypothetical protein